MTSQLQQQHARVNTIVKNALPILGLIISLAAAPAYPHHSFAMFDREKVVSMKGVVREFQWTNPHCWVQLVAKDDHGASQDWALEALSPNVIGRMGWKRNSLKPGDEITAFFNPTRDGSHGGNLVKVTRADGTVVGDSP
jgi:hypothetical protein